MSEYTTDSLDTLQFMYDRKAPVAVLACVIVAMVIVCSVICYSAMNMKTESVELTGYVDTYDAIYISTTLSGVIESEPLDEGSEVKEGDLIFRITNKEIEYQLEAYNDYITYYSEEMESYSTIVSSMEKYDVNYRPNTVDSNRNPFLEDDVLFHYMYDSYLKELKEIDDKHQKAVKAKKEAREIAEKTAEDEGKDFDYSKWSSEYDEDHKEEPLTEQRRQVVAQAIYDSKKTIQGIEPTLMQYKKSAELLSAQIESGKLTAPISGTIHYASPIFKGQYVTEGTNLAAISENTNDSETIIVLLPAQYRAFVSEDMDVSLTVMGFPENIYGKLDGSIRSINQIVTMTEQGSFYSTRISVGEHDEEFRILPGMIVMCNIPYSERSWLDWAISQFEV